MPHRYFLSLLMVTQYCQAIFLPDKNAENEFSEFVGFALDYTEDLRKHWWELPGEKLQERKHLLFRNKIIAQPDGNVYTLIYSLQKKNNNPKVVENHNLEELAGTAPASAGLSWLIFYRLSLLSGLRQLAVKQTKN